MMEIKQAILAADRINRPGIDNPCQYITIHNTGNFKAGAHAAAHAAWLQTVNELVSWHYTVDDMEIYQHLPDDETAYHAGDGSGDGNRKSIAIEICVNADGNLLAATDNAARLAARLCRKHNIPLENIVQHHHWSGKNCPAQLRGNEPYSWEMFLSKVADELQELPKAWALQAADWSIAQNIIRGDGMSYNWQQPVSREELAVILYRFKNSLSFTEKL